MEQKENIINSHHKEAVENDNETGESIKSLDGKSGKQSFESFFKKTIITAAVLSVIFGSFAGGFMGFLAASYGTNGVEGMVKDIKSGNIENLYNPKEVQDKETFSLVDEDSAVINAVEKSSPAVVSVVITKDVPVGDQINNPFFNDPFFNPFGFRRQLEPGGETEQREIGGGSGFIIDPDGYIVTNKHVVEDEDAAYSIILNDGKKLNAQILARDPFNDIAIIKIDEKNHPIINLGSSDDLKIGQTVIAIGNSLGEFRNTVSKGIISGLKRNVNAGNSEGRRELLQEVIQTDAAINPGNSGGPLLNIAGQVVGINVAMAEGAENIGFAIPSDQIKQVLQSVKESGRIVRPYIGIRYMIIDQQLREKNNIPYSYGALVVRGNERTELPVVPGSPAGKAGIKENDIILEIDGMKIDQENDLSTVIRKKKVGDEIELKIWDGVEEKTIKVKLEEAF